MLLSLLILVSISIGNPPIVKISSYLLWSFRFFSYAFKKSHLITIFKNYVLGRFGPKKQTNLFGMAYVKVLHSASGNVERFICILYNVECGQRNGVKLQMFSSVFKT